MLQVSNLNYDSWQTVHYQRATVLLTELVLVFALHLYVHEQPIGRTSHSRLADTSSHLLLHLRSSLTPLHCLSYSLLASSSSTIFTSSTMASSTAFSFCHSSLHETSPVFWQAVLSSPRCYASSTSTFTWLRPTSSSFSAHTAWDLVLSSTFSSSTASSLG